jgi:hypothetical protein
MKRILLFLTIWILTLSCKDEGGDDVNPMNLNFDLSGARAILYSDEGVSSGRSKAGETHVFKIDDSGNITPVLEGIQVLSAHAISWGIIVTIYDDAESDGYRTFYAKSDNTFGEIEGSIGKLIGENDDGDVVFSNCAILRKATLTLEEMETTLTSPTAQAMSGNFAIVTDNSVFQIHNTVTGRRYNVRGCNGPRIVAMDPTRSLLDDCQNAIIIDMTTGQRIEGDIAMLNHEGVRTQNGAVVLSQGLGADYNLYYLAEINVNGDVTLVNGYGFAPGSSSCSNCSDPNSVLFKTGEYFIVRELSKVSVVKRGLADPIFILTNYNVTSISVTDNLVYYLAEDSAGIPIIGVYNLLNGENQILSESKAMKFTAVQTIG